jgi:arylsulfatase I/J
MLRAVMLRAVMLCALALFASASSSPASPLPNIVLILADDYGHANIGYNRAADDPGKPEAHTPNLDALAAAGVVLEHHYAYKICSPSRSSLQSGRLAVHVNTVNTGVTFSNPDDPMSGFAGIPRNMTGMATKMREAGYQTHAIGKWDAGMATPDHTPLGRGYDSWIGYYQHANDYFTKGSTNIGATGEVDNCLNRFTDVRLSNSTVTVVIVRDSKG